MWEETCIIRLPNAASFLGLLAGYINGLSYLHPIEPTCTHLDRSHSWQLFLWLSQTPEWTLPSQQWYSVIHPALQARSQDTLHIQVNQTIKPASYITFFGRQFGARCGWFWKNILIFGIKLKLLELAPENAMTTLQTMGVIKNAC